MAAPPAWRRFAPWIAAGTALLIGIALLVPGARRVLSADASVALSRLSVATVERGDFVRDIAAEGRIVAAVSPTLYAPAAGIVQLKAKAGDRVEKDAVIAVIDSPELTNRLAQEQAALAALDIDWQRAKLQARRQQLTVQEAVDRAQVDRNTAAREVERSRKAFEQGAYSELQVLRNEDALEKAEFALTRAREDLKLEPEQIRFDVESKKLARDRQQLLVADLSRQVSQLALRSPVAGQIGQLLVAERASVARDLPLMTVVDLSALELEIKVPETFAKDLATGIPAEITGGGKSWPGEISAVSPEVVAGQVSARVRFSGSQPEGLRQNQRLSSRILLDEKKGVLLVQRGPFLDTGAGRVAYVVKDGGAVRTAIEVGATSLNKVEILGGLAEGDRVVISGTDDFNGAERVVLH
ncbi:efflux RND transporter periplasmic adaptor subunit [Nevskia sp.]|uniref:efflux RND transporter periplasmic adaptor subunit n=1 Tax=Nevskia sp. TaxID=1929292 RepID=UPI0025F9842D|nr:efflux RND transporter periplasmic adaptor subunit [Nevskia sp.]